MDGLREEHANPLAQTNPFHRVQSGSVATCEAHVSVEVVERETNTNPLSPIWTPFGRVLRNSSGSILSRHTTTDGLLSSRNGSVHRTVSCCSLDRDDVTSCPHLCHVTTFSLLGLIITGAIALGFVSLHD